jgi:hypothetical protein
MIGFKVWRTDPKPNKKIIKENKIEDREDKVKKQNQIQPTKSTNPCHKKHENIRQ